MLLYLVTNELNGKVYVGQTIRPLSVRWRDSLDYAFRRGIKTRLYHAMRKYGAAAFTVQPVAVAGTQEQLDALERAWIIVLRARDPLFGYNITAGGDGFRANHTAETKAKISVTMTGHCHITEAGRAAVSQAQKGRARTATQLAAMRQNGINAKGRKLSAQAVANIRAGKQKAVTARG